MRLIDADELLFELTHWKDNKGWYHDTRTDVYHISEIKTVCDRMPNIDAIQVIRCRDCMYCEYGECIIHQKSSGTGLAINEETDPNGYCHRAERKEE